LEKDLVASGCWPNNFLMKHFPHESASPWQHAIS